MTIRRATEADFDAVCRLARRFFDATRFGELMEFDRDSFHATFQALLGADGVCLVAEKGGLVVGIAGALAYPVYFNLGHRTGQELFWWVEPEERGSTTGARMFAALEAWAREVGCKTFTMVALEALKPAQVGRIYIRSGYAVSEHSYIKEL